MKDAREISGLLKRVKEVLQSAYGDRLKKVILYGSFARNQASGESDIDIAVVLNGEVDKIKEIERIHDLIYPLALEYGEVISVNPISERELADTEWPLYEHIRKEGVPV